MSEAIKVEKSTGSKCNPIVNGSENPEFPLSVELLDRCLDCDELYFEDIWFEPMCRLKECKYGISQH